MQSGSNRAGTLILPRVNVQWGDLNLTAPGPPGTMFEGVDVGAIGPLVYDVRVSLEDQGQTPTGSMKWNSSGKAFSVYEKCIQKFNDYSIMVTFHYVNSRYITFEFYWGGQTDTFGSEMDVTVKLVSLMDGLINANFYATVQADKEEKGKSFKDSVAELQKQFGVDGVISNLIRYTPQALTDCEKATVKVSYNEGSTFMDAVQNLVKDNGNNVFFNNIGTSNAVVHTPYSHETRNAPLPRLPSQTLPDPTIRYYYVIGPYIINSFNRTYEWQPPQKSQEINAIYARKAQAEKDAKSSQNTPDKNQEQSSNAATAGTGVSGARNRFNTSSTNNEDGPRKQDLFTKEKAAKLALTTMMCPSLTGIKPLDIIIITTGSGKTPPFIEDWIVTTVEYQQTQGGVDLAIQATRMYGKGEQMSPGAFDPGSVDYANLGQWQGYAWDVSDNYTRGIYDPSLAPSTLSPAAQTPGQTTSPQPGTGGELTDAQLTEASKNNPDVKYLNNNLTQEELKGQIDTLWPSKLPGGVKPFEPHLGAYNTTTINDGAFYQYVSEYRKDSLLGAAPNAKVSYDGFYVTDVPPAVLDGLYRDYVNGGRAEMLDYYGRGVELQEVRNNLILVGGTPYRADDTGGPSGTAPSPISTLSVLGPQYSFTRDQGLLRTSPSVPSTSGVTPTSATSATPAEPQPAPRLTPTTVGNASSVYPVEAVDPSVPPETVRAAFEADFPASALLPGANGKPIEHQSGSNNLRINDPVLKLYAEDYMYRKYGPNRTQPQPLPYWDEGSVFTGYSGATVKMSSTDLNDITGTYYSGGRGAMLDRYQNEGTLQNNYRTLVEQTGRVLSRRIDRDSATQELQRIREANRLF